MVNYFVKIIFAKIYDLFKDLFH